MVPAKFTPEQRHDPNHTARFRVYLEFNWLGGGLDMNARMLNRASIVTGVRVLVAASHPEYSQSNTEYREMAAGLQGGLPSLRFAFPCFIILDHKGSGKQVLAAGVDTDDDLYPSVSSVTSASSPSPRLENAPTLPRDDSHLSAPLTSFPTSPAGVSSLSASGSPEPFDSFRAQSVTPNPPNLPVLPRYHGTGESLNSSPENRRAESSVYYTTAWGSPYAAPSPRTLSLSLSQNAGGVGRESGDSSPVSMRSGTFHGIEYNNPNIDNNNTNDTNNDNERLRPSAGEGSSGNLYSGILDRSPGRDLLGRKGGKSIKDFTQDWINQYLSGQPRTERSNWLSDDSGSEAPSFFTAKNNFAEDDWLGLEEDTRNEEILRTPTLSDFVGRKKTAGLGESSSSARQKLKDYIHKRTETLRQEDFWGFAYDKDPQPITMDNTDTLPPAEPEASKVDSPVEKPLPPPPAEEPVNGSSLQAEAKTEATEAAESAPQPQPTKPALTRTATSTIQRNRKKIPWRGKACIIALPLEDKRGSEESGYRLLTPEDVEQRLKAWEEKGYDTRGFKVSVTDHPDHPDSFTIGDGGMSRMQYPDDADVKAEWADGHYGVHFPAKGEWDAYVNYLQEEKLRALGVSLGDEEEEQPSISPASAAMSQMAPFPGLIESPPIPTASAASNPLGVPHPFSPQLGQSATPHGIGPIASPAASQFGVQTPFLGVDQPIIPGYPLPFQPTPPTQGTFTPQSFLNARQPGAIPGTLPNLTSMLSPVSPVNDQGIFQPGFDNVPKDSFDGQFQHDLQDDGSGEPLPRVQTPTDQPDNFHASNVEIAHPTPRGHSRGQNLSETLQKGLDHINHSDYHLEKSIERQLEEDDRDAGRDGFKSGLLNSRWAMPETDPNYNQHDGSDIDTNPSLSGAPQGHGPLANDISWHESKPSVHSHQSKLSSSTFNVEAKEFDPVGAFSPQNYPFQGNAFQFQPPGPSLFTFGSGKQGFQGAVPPTNSYNVAAPAFNPGEGSDQKSTPYGGFKFSTASFNVDAPTFNPGASVNSASSEQPSGERTKIFGDIDIAEISKPAKKSKAIPIVRPDESEEKRKDQEAEAENENSQPAATDRHKRARRGEEPSDGKEHISVPTRALTETNNAHTPQESATTHAQAEGKENAAPEKDDSHVTDTNPPTTERKDTPVSEASTWPPAEGRDHDEQAITGSPVRHEAPEQGREATGDKKPDFEQPPTQENAPVTAPKEQDQPTEDAADAQKSSFISPTAKPFQFKPAASEFVPSSNDNAEKTPEKPDSGLSGLMSSRHAGTPPPAAPKDKPLPPEPPRPDPAEKDQAPEAKTHRPETSDDDGSPDEDELNAIMEQLNDDSDVGIERVVTPRPPAKAPEPTAEPSKEKRHVPAETRSEAPSPSPGRGPVSTTLDIPKLDFDAQSQAFATPSKSAVGTMHSPVRQLVNENDHISDWDDIISSGEDEKFLNRSRFFDRRINDLVGSAVDERLSPLERALGTIQQSVTSIASGAQNKWTLHSTSATGEDSDADDEDDEYAENASFRAKSPLHHQRDRKMDKLKNIIQDALAARGLPKDVEPPVNNELVQLQKSFAELRDFTSQKLSHDPTANMKGMMQEVIAAQLSLQNSRPSDADEIGADSLMLQIDGLKNMLRVADERAEQEYKMRREGQDAMAELQRLLKVAEEDAARHSEAAESAETRFLQFKEEKIPYFEHIQSRSDALASERESLRLTLAEISSKNITLQGTLDEYRVSSDHWKRENEKNKLQVEEAQEENKKLHETIDHMRVRLEDGMTIRQNLGDKFDRLQEEMANVTRDITRDQATWRRREEENEAKTNELRAAYSRELKLREKLEDDISDLEQQEREAAKLKFIFGQSQQENARLEELVASLRLENHGLASKASHFEREFNEARESSRAEIQRTRNLLETDLEAANSQVNIVRAEMEAQIIRYQSQHENVKMDADTARERYEMLLEEANEAKANAISSKELALDDQRKLHERGLNDLRERHARAMHNSSEDKQRNESYMTERFALSEEKARHYQDRAEHLEEKLEIAKSAARAAAEAAQTAKVSPDVSNSGSGFGSQSMPFNNRGSEVPEKISPQALRESILVLQDQLQQRELRIDELEQEVSSIDKDAPNKLKEKDTEITWLRELLGVRIDDLQDIINTLSRPSFDQNAVRDAAIRLRANLQMQLQERERAQTGQSFPSLPSISEITASPRALPLAAAAAWGNWRSRTRENSTSETPSKSGNASTFLSGLLTPPGSNVRQSQASSSSVNSPVPNGSRRSSEARSLKSFNSTPRPLSARQRSGSNAIPEPPRTPPLLRRSSYDHDAEPTNYEQGSFGGDYGENENLADEMVSASPKDTGDANPFGPQLVNEWS